MTALHQQLARLVDNPELADVEFLVGADRTPIYASRLHLTVRSPVFAALFTGGFKESLAPPSDSCSSSSSEGGDTVLTSSTVGARPLFWRSVPLPDMEPLTFRRLLHCCHTDQLPPDLDPATASTSNRAAELVSLFAAADHFMLEHCKKLVETELKTALSCHNVLPAFDRALAVAPDLADSLCLPVVTANAAVLLGNTNPDIEDQWLGLSTAGAEAVVASNLAGLSEVDVFRAVERWYLHLLPQRGQAEDQQEEQEEQEEMETEEEEEAKAQARRVLEKVQYLLMSADEIRDVVEKSGLLPDSDLLRIYRRHSLYHRVVVTAPLPSDERDKVPLFRQMRHHRGKLPWTATLSKKNGEFIVWITNNQTPDILVPAGTLKVSYQGIAVRLFLDRDLRQSLPLLEDDVASVSSSLGVYLGAPPQRAPKSVLALVHVPASAMRFVAK